MPNLKILKILKFLLTNKILCDRIRCVAGQLCWCGSMAEQLICNQQVDGSTPFTSSTVLQLLMGDFPSGQRGQTVNLLSTTSLVRIQHPPPTKKELLSTKSSFFVYPSRRLCISSDASRYIIKGDKPPLYLITRQRASCLRLDNIQHYVLMICNSYGIDDIQGYALIYFRKCGIF